MLYIAICDDTPTELNHLESLVWNYFEELGFQIQISTFHNGFQFLDATTPFDICFLDIYMPGLNGMEVAKELRQIDKETHLIFTTSSLKFAVEGYKVQASNYLVKPIAKTDFRLAMEHIVQKLSPSQDDCLVLPSQEGTELLYLPQIVMAESEKRTTLVTLRNKEKRIITMPFGEFCLNLEGREGFCVVSRSVLVNFDRITGTKKDILYMETGDEVVMPRRRKQEITTLFLNYVDNQKE